MKTSDSQRDIYQTIMKRFTFSMDDNHRREIQALAERYSVSDAWVARWLIQNGLEKIKAGELQFPLDFK